MKQGFSKYFAMHEANRLLNSRVFKSYLRIFLVIRKATSKNDDCIVRRLQKLLLHDS